MNLSRILPRSNDVHKATAGSLGRRRWLSVASALDGPTGKANCSQALATPVPRRRNITRPHPAAIRLSHKLVCVMAAAAILAIGERPATADHPCIQFLAIGPALGDDAVVASTSFCSQVIAF